jgi:hypothetical protein
VEKVFLYPIGRDFGYIILSFYLVAIFAQKRRDTGRYAKKRALKSTILTKFMNRNTVNAISGLPGFMRKGSSKGFRFRSGEPIPVRQYGSARGPGRLTFLVCKTFVVHITMDDEGLFFRLATFRLFCELWIACGFLPRAVRQLFEL